MCIAGLLVAFQQIAKWGPQQQQLEQRYGYPNHLLVLSREGGDGWGWDDCWYLFWILDHLKIPYQAPVRPLVSVFYFKIFKYIPQMCTRVITCLDFWEQHILRSPFDHWHVFLIAVVRCIKCSELRSAGLGLSSSMPSQEAAVSWGWDLRNGLAWVAMTRSWQGKLHPWIYRWCSVRKSGDFHGFPDFFKELYKLYRNFVSSVSSVSSPSCFMVDPCCNVRNSEAGTKPKPSHPARLLDHHWGAIP